jgi:hypothetical protein
MGGKKAWLTQKNYYIGFMIKMGDIVTTATSRFRLRIMQGVRVKGANGRWITGILSREAVLMTSGICIRRVYSVIVRNRTKPQVSTATQDVNQAIAIER